MAARRQVVVAVIGVFLVLRISPVMHVDKISKTQVGVIPPMLLVVLYQIPQVGRLVNAKAGKQTASQYPARQHDGNNRFHNSLRCYKTNVPNERKFPGYHHLPQFRNNLIPDTY